MISRSDTPAFAAEAASPPHSEWTRSDFIERTYGGTRRRVKAIGRLPGERTCLSLVWAVLDRPSKGWRGVKMMPNVVRHLQHLRREFLTPPHLSGHDELVAEAVTPAA